MKGKIIALRVNWEFIHSENRFFFFLKIKSFQKRFIVQYTRKAKKKKILLYNNLKNIYHRPICLHRTYIRLEVLKVTF